MNTPTLNHIKLLILAFILSVGIGTLSAWSNPPGAPTTCPTGTPGCDAPVHIGPAGQIKTGGLSLGSGLDDTGVGLAVLGGKVGIGTNNPTQKLDVAGYVKASTGFCIGASCITSWPTGGGPTAPASEGEIQVAGLSNIGASWSGGGPGGAGANVVKSIGGTSPWIQVDGNLYSGNQQTIYTVKNISASTLKVISAMSVSGVPSVTGCSNVSENRTAWAVRTFYTTLAPGASVTYDTATIVAVCLEQHSSLQVTASKN